MAHRVRVNEGTKKIALPNHEVYDGPVEVVLTDDEFAQLRQALFTSGKLTDLGAVSDVSTDDLPDDVVLDADFAAAFNAALATATIDGGTP